MQLEVELPQDVHLLRQEIHPPCVRHERLALLRALGQQDLDVARERRIDLGEAQVDLGAAGELRPAAPDVEERLVQPERDRHEGHQLVRVGAPVVAARVGDLEVEVVCSHAEQHRVELRLRPVAPRSVVVIHERARDLVGGQRRVIHAEERVSVVDEERAFA
ncbi:hypothetical protein WME94_52800 [Sorangium sp. So ce429]